MINEAPPQEIKTEKPKSLLARATSWLNNQLEDPEKKADEIRKRLGPLFETPPSDPSEVFEIAEEAQHVDIRLARLSCTLVLYIDPEHECAKEMMKKIE